MLLKTPHIFVKTLSTSSKSLNWRSQVKQTQLISQITSLLFQRHNWPSLLSSLNLSSKLTPQIFLQILLNSKKHPQISLNFFKWVQTNLKFQPDLKSQCHLIRILIGSGLTRPAKPILDSMIKTDPPTRIVDSMIQACRGSDLQSIVFGFVLDRYCNKGLFGEGLEVFRNVTVYGYVPTICGCNALLDVIHNVNDNALFWCFYAAMVRNGVISDQFTWLIIAKILCRTGKFERIEKFIELGVCDAVFYDMLIDGYCKVGNFTSAFDRLIEMGNNKYDPCFSTYSSILDGACRHGNDEMIHITLDSMVEKGLLLKRPSFRYDSIIHKCCKLGNIYAAEMFFKRACDENVGLEGASYGCMLRALSKEGRAKEGIEVYKKILEKGLNVNNSCYDAFVNALCREDPSKEVSQLLKDLIF